MAVSPNPLVSDAIGSIVKGLKSAIPYKVTLWTPGSNKETAHP